MKSNVNSLPKDEYHWKRKQKKSVLSDWKLIDNDREKYAAYLCSREWSVLKEAVKERSKGTCERCKLFDGDAVHHLTYERKYHENIEDLQHTCSHCHSFIHGKTQQDPCQADPYVVRFLLKCAKRERKPIPFEVLTGLRGIDAFNDEIHELIRASIILCAAGLEKASFAICKLLPFDVPFWFISRDHHTGPSECSVAFMLMNISNNFDNSWWSDDEDEDE